MPAPIVAAAAATLLPVLVEAGTGLLAGIVRSKSPAAAVVVEKIGAALGTAATPEAIAEAHQADPAGVEATVRQVEREEADMWRALAAMAAEIHTTMRAEMTATEWLQRIWRPVYALELTAECFMLAATMVALLVAGDRLAIAAIADLSGLGITYLGARLGVLGVYVDARKREKLAGRA